MILRNNNLKSELEYFEILKYEIPSNIDIQHKEIFSNFEEISLVGNGLMETSYGDIIDSFKYVCRFNNFKICGYSDVIGSKTTHHVLNSLCLKNIKPNSDINYILMDTGRPKVVFDFYFENFGKMDNIFLISPSNYVNYGRFFAGKCKTQGFLFAEIVKSHFENISIFGFCGNTHYFNENHRMDNAHPVEKEHEEYNIWASNNPNFKIFS